VEESLRNEVYAGTAVWHPGTPEEGRKADAHPAIIEPETFAAVALIRAQNARRVTRSSTRRAHPLSRPAYCAVCGSSCKGDISGRAPYHRASRFPSTGTT
jgi:hypothetical protein